MQDLGDFFSPDHKRLLSIAAWARVLAWGILIFGILFAGVSSFGRYTIEIQSLNSSQIKNPFLFLLQEDLYFIVDLVVDFVYSCLKSVVFYVALKGISMGLYMIVETNVNYRELDAVEGQDE